ncbi:MAG: hypothetical protein EA405_03815 [Rhodospirillales bacterium]|nr:MAG: hypothetical protein EA405_03815 [Rhodospirillales bacterium]
MLILGLNSTSYDAGAALHDDYRLIAAIAEERLTRRKGAGGQVPTKAVDEVLAVAGADRRDIGAVVLDRRSGHEATVDPAGFLAGYRLPPRIPIRCFDHHLAHALPALFHTDWDDALLYTSDGGGDRVPYSARGFRKDRIEDLFTAGDGSRPARPESLGLAYGYATEALGYRINRHEGKLTGLAAYGAPEIADDLAAHFQVTDDGRVLSDFPSDPAMRRFVLDWAAGKPPEVVAASVQKVLEDKTLAAVARLLDRAGSRNLGLSGGVFGNVRLNQLLADRLGVAETFIYPAMSDQGLAAGGILQFLLQRDGLGIWLDRRYRLEHLYLGRDWGSETDRVLAATPGLRPLDLAGLSPAEAAAARIAGEVVAIFTRGMEYGPRALGARSILAAPTDARINQTLNARLSRSDFMPFAPVVRDVDADAVFDLGPAKAYAARFMTITCRVRDAWRARIPAVVHVDGTARPQVIRRAPNPLYYDILSAYAAGTGIPVLINTSFNAHEEPIINTPAECARALLDNRVDAVVTQRGLYASAT